MPELIDNLSDAKPIPVFGFIHVATHGTWRDVYAEQLELLRSSGLFDRTSRIYVGIVGPEAYSFEVSEDKITVIYRSPDFCEYEFPTLRFLKTFCSTHAGLVYYVHSKGVFRNSAGTEDWRRYMQYFVIERYAECIQALAYFDICGVNWQELPWQHFSGNFWWATASYVAKLPDLDQLPPVLEGWDQQERHQCERWIGAGTDVRPASLHQSRSDHYKFEYPRSFYAGPPKGTPYSQLRIALIFDNLIRRDTTGIYCLRALRQLTHVSHYMPWELGLVPREVFNLFLYIDDGLDYPLPDQFRPSAIWAIDTHLNPQRLIRRAGTVDFVFAAQRDGVELLCEAGIQCVGWLPLACDPEVHAKLEVPKTFDVSFVGHLSTPDRVSLARIVRDRFPNSFIGQRFFMEMAETYSASRVVLNQSVRNDINMRVFEALSCGSLLISNDLANNGQGQLLTEGVHYIAYRDLNELVSKIQYYLSHPAEGEAIAVKGRIEALSRHTYWHRMNSIMEAVIPNLPRAVVARSPVPVLPADSVARPRLTSIIVLTLNQLEYTRRCLSALREKTLGPYELIVVDNGSTDGTLDYLRHCPDLRLIENSENRGFPAGVNQGIAASAGDRILLLNNDTLVTRDWLSQLLRVLDSDAGIGLVGPLSNGSLGQEFGRFAADDISQIDQVARSIAREHSGRCEDVSILRAFCLLIRREVIDRIGLFDEAFGIGTYDDYEYCRRAASVGYRLVMTANAYVHHFGAVTLNAIGINVTALLQKNQLLFETRWKKDFSARDPGPQCDVLTSIVLVTFNGVDHTRACLESLARHTPEHHEIIVVDNGSSDGTIPFLRSQASVRFIQNATNQGFPAAANQGLRAAAGERILLLNNDVIVTQGWLKRMLDILDRFSDVGLVGPCSNEVSGPQRVPATYNTIEALDQFAFSWAEQHQSQYEDVPRLVGFCLLLRREVIDQVGLLDERFGIGNFEDDDYCRRSILAGFRAVIARDAFIHHVGSATFKSTGTDYRALLERNRKLYLEKWSSPQSDRISTVNPPATEPSVGQPCPPSLSLCMIVRNSSRTLRACLESIHLFVDELIVVDTGSSDDTVSIAEAFGATVRYFPWCDDFSAARNESIAAASRDWIFWMDSDDTIDAENGRKLRELVSRQHAPETLGFVLQVHCPTPASLASHPSYATATVVDHVKVFRRHPDLRFSGRIHEQVLPSIRNLGGEVEWTDIWVCHSGSDTSLDGKARKHERDIRILDAELAADPDHTFTLFNKGMTLLDMGKPDAALDCLCRSLQLATKGDSHVRKLYAFITQAYTELGRPGTAIRACEQGLELCPEDLELMFRMGSLQQTVKQSEEAEGWFKRVIETRPARYFSSMDHGILGIKAWHNLALIYEQRGDLKPAADAWHQVLRYDSSNLPAWLGLLDALAGAGNVAELQSIAASTDHPGIPPEVPHLARSRALARLDGPQAAMVSLEQAMLTCESADLLNALSELAFQHDQPQIAERTLQKLARRRPEDPSTLQNLAAVYVRLGRFDEAANCAELSLKLRPNHPPALQLRDLACRMAAAPVQTVHSPIGSETIRAMAQRSVT